MRDQRWLTGAPKYTAVVSLLALATAGLGAALLAPRLPSREGESANATRAMTIDLNQASVAELEALPRIGPSLARRIVEDRAANGPFRTIDDLDRVKGIGKRTVELVKPFARVSIEEK